MNLLSVDKMIRAETERALDGDSDTFAFADGTAMVFRRVVELTDRATELDLYLCDTEEQTEAAFAIHMGTVEENERLYTRKEVADAEAMRWNWRNLGFPGVSTIRKMSQQGTVLGMPGTVQDLMRAGRLK